MTISISTDKGKLRVISTFRISRSLQRKIEASLKSAVDDVKPIGGLLDDLKKKDPVIGTPRGALIAYMTGQSWTQKKLAQKTVISQADISKMVNGKRPIGLAVAKKLAKALGVEYHKFL